MAVREEYFEYQGVELQTVVQCAGCGERLPINSDGHECADSADLHYSEKVVVIPAWELLAAHNEAQYREEACGYDEHRNALGIDY